MNRCVGLIKCALELSDFGSVCSDKLVLCLESGLGVRNRTLEDGVVGDPGG